jgi:hypothetical protein
MKLNPLPAQRRKSEPFSVSFLPNCNIWFEEKFILFSINKNPFVLKIMQTMQKCEKYALATDFSA